MLNFKKLTITLVLTSFSVLPIAAYAKNQISEWCEQQWTVESAKLGEVDMPDNAALLARWKSYESKCTGSIAYEARLAIAYVSVKQVDKARSVLKPLSKDTQEYGHLIELALLQADEADLMNGVVNERDIAQLERRYLALVKKYPNFLEGYALLGGLQSMLNKHAEAIRSLEYARETKMNAAGIYRNLTISYAALGRYKDAAQSADEAYRLNKAVLSDQYFVYGLAKAKAGVGDFRAAETVLRVIAAKKPDVRRDPDFKDAVDFVTARMNAFK